MQLTGEESYEARSEVVDLASHWPVRIPASGFDLVEGVTVPITPACLTGGNKTAPYYTETYLVERSAQSAAMPIEAKISETLYQDFFSLRPNSAGDILKFANRFGLLSGVPRHFHRKADMTAALGEPLRPWTREITLFKRVFDLWETAKQDKPFRVEAVLKEFGAPWPPHGRSRGEVQLQLQWPPEWIAEDPIEFARRAVVATINYSLAGSGGSYIRKCGLHGCGHIEETENGFDLTRAALQERRRKHGGRSTIALTTLAGSLRKILWLQLACYVAGMRKTKKCEAVDCKLGGLIDVTDCARPGKVKFHPQCKERKKKQNRKVRLISPPLKD